MPENQLVDSLELDRTRVGLDSKQENYGEKRTVIEKKDDSILMSNNDDTGFQLNPSIRDEYDSKPIKLMDLNNYNKQTTQPS